MYSVLLSKMETGFPIIKDRLNELIKPTHKVIIIPWSFPIETDEVGLKEYFQTKIKNKYIKPLLELGVLEENIQYLNCLSLK